MSFELELVKAFIALWRPSNNTAHPCYGELGISLWDVYQLTGLSMEDMYDEFGLTNQILKGQGLPWWVETGRTCRRGKEAQNTSWSKFLLWTLLDLTGRESIGRREKPRILVIQSTISINGSSRWQFFTLPVNQTRTWPEVNGFLLRINRFWS